MARTTDLLWCSLMCAGCTGGSAATSPTSPTSTSSTPPPAPAPPTTYYGLAFTEAGYDLAAVPWDGALALAVSAPAHVLNDDWEEVDPRDMGGFVLTAPFAGGVVQD